MSKYKAFLVLIKLKIKISKKCVMYRSILLYCILTFKEIKQRDSSQTGDCVDQAYLDQNRNKSNQS